MYSFECFEFVIKTQQNLIDFSGFGSTEIPILVKQENGTMTIFCSIFYIPLQQ
jgi:hypothetical protein